MFISAYILYTTKKDFYFYTYKSRIKHITYARRRRLQPLANQGEIMSFNADTAKIKRDVCKKQRREGY